MRMRGRNHYSLASRVGARRHVVLVVLVVASSHVGTPASPPCVSNWQAAKRHLEMGNTQSAVVPVANHVANCVVPTLHQIYVI